MTAEWLRYWAIMAVLGIIMGAVIGNESRLASIEKTVNRMAVKSK